MSVELAFDPFGAASSPGPPIVILHGLLGSATNWRSIAKRLSRARRVFALDLRNHGASPHARPMDYPQMADDVSGFLRSRGLATCALIGHSMGGKAAMCLALREPEKVERLLVVDIAPVAHARGFEPILDALDGLRPETLESRAEADRQLAERIAEPALRSFLLHNLVRGEQGYRWRIDLEAIRGSMPALRGFPAFPHAPEYAGPTLFLTGGASGYVEEAHHESIRRLFPRARIASVPGAGHWVHAERPSEFLRLAAEFLES